MQLLLAQFSRANSRLAVENEKLRSGRQELVNDHAEVLNEIEHLRNRLCLLEECSTSGAQQDNRSGTSQARIGIARKQLNVRIAGRDLGAGNIADSSTEHLGTFSGAQRYSAFVITIFDCSITF
jgi:hypothetical protein